MSTVSASTGASSHHFGVVDVVLRKAQPVTQSFSDLLRAEAIPHGRSWFSQPFYPLYAKSQVATAIEAMIIKRVVASVKVLSLSRSFCINLTSSRFGASTLQISIAKEVEIPRFASTYARIAVTQTKGRTEKLG